MKRAYLCAFKINEKFRGYGLGSRLMDSVLTRVKEKGFSEVTIGVDNDDYEKLKKMYNSWGFDELIKLQHYDYHCLDSNNNPIYYEERCELYLKRFN